MHHHVLRVLKLHMLPSSITESCFADLPNAFMLGTQLQVLAMTDLVPWKWCALPSRWVAT